MKRLVLVCLLACSSKPQPTTTPDPAPGGGAVQDTRTPLEKRRDAACEIVAKRNTECALADTKADFAAGKIKKEQFEKDTKPAVLEKNTEKYADDCKAHKDYSSRQIRVLEKCPEYETECEPLLKCLDNVKPGSKDKVQTGM